MKQDKISNMAGQNSRLAQFLMSQKTNTTTLWHRVAKSRQAKGLDSWLGWIDIDRATVLGILARIWPLGAGTVNALLIASRFSPELQGYYFTFNNLLALQIFVELGLGTVIIQFTSHEWSRLGFDEHGGIVGNPEALSRLSSLAQAAFRWYTLAAALAALMLGLGGWTFFSRQPQVGIDWLGPWLALSILTGFRLFLVPIWSLLEGCNQVAQAYTYRLIQNVLSSLALWSALLLGARLWTGPVTSAVALAWGIFFLSWRYRPFIRSLLAPARGPRVRWRADIWPLQWRIALTWLSGYFVFSLFTPVLFYFRGSVVAGQAGMTWSLVNALSAIAFLFVSTKVPRFGMLIARHAYGALDRLFLRSTLSSVVVASLGASVFGAGVYGLYAVDHPLAMRILPFAPTAMLLLAMVLNQIAFAMGAYLRAHKREPYLVILVVRAVVATVTTLLLGSRFGATGVAAGFLAVNGLTLIPASIIFYRCRAEWHAHPDGSLSR